MTTYICATIIRTNCAGTTDDPLVIYCPEHQALRDQGGPAGLPAHPAAQEIDAAFRAAAARITQP